MPVHLCAGFENTRQTGRVKVLRSNRGGDYGCCHGGYNGSYNGLYNARYHRRHDGWHNGCYYGGCYGGYNSSPYGSEVYRSGWENCTFFRLEADKYMRADGSGRGVEDSRNLV